MQIRRSPNGARHSPPHLPPPGRHRSERVVVINRNRWSPSIGTGGRHHSVRPVEPSPGTSKFESDLPGSVDSNFNVTQGETAAGSGTDKPNRERSSSREPATVCAKAPESETA